MSESDIDEKMIIDILGVPSGLRKPINSLAVHVINHPMFADESAKNSRMALSEMSSIVDAAFCGGIYTRMQQLVSKAVNP
jgi:hypothetical protein